MRLVCPNCDAQYEVDDAAIPLTGRDVQCSNCGHGWFQKHPEVEEEEELAEEIAEADEPLAEEPAPGPYAERGLDIEPDAEPEPEPALDVAEDHPEPPLPKPVIEVEAPAMRRRALDESVLSVLREEAEREAAVRRAENPGGVEVQTDLGLTPPPPLAQPVPPSVLAARERFADLSVSPEEAEADPEEEAALRPASRRQLLPDIEEINSTLRASSEPRSEAEGAVPPVVIEEERRGGFRSGFLLMVLIAAVLWATYVMAPRIAESIPASAGAMQAYVDGVDRARIGVDAALQSASRSLRSLSGSDS